jgi:glycosyltransferase involved in cell wall biosynthesis
MQINLSLAIPSFKRPNDLNELLRSISESTVMPFEIIVIDDCSDNFNEIKFILDQWKKFFLMQNVLFRYKRNSVNVGYDKNLRELIKFATGDYICFIGNDDAVNQNGIDEILKFIELNPDLAAHSRSFTKFTNSPSRVTGVSRFYKKDHTFTSENSSPNNYYRLCCFFSGLVFKRKWALNLDTDKYDGSLYYQLYLFASAYYQTGVGYISYPTVAGRIDGIPLFGNSVSESNIHIPGSYSAKARSNMWSSILKIAKDIDEVNHVSSVSFIHHEIKTRMAFHVFEMYTQKNLSELFSLVSEYKKLKIFYHPIPLLLFIIVLTFRRYSIYFFSLIRFLYQR